MRISRAAGVSMALLAVLPACDRSDPPSERLERAAEGLVAEVESESLPTPQPTGPWAPRDECSDMPGASAFLAAFESAIEARDADGLVALTADDVKLDFGGGAGHQQLRERLAASDGAFWETLDEMADLGCASDASSTITIPWYFAQEIPVDPYAGAIVTGQDVPLYDSPSTGGEVLATLSWDAVEQLPADTPGEAFTKVKWSDTSAAVEPADGEAVEGYVASENLRGIIDYRLIANRRNDRWRITALLAGD